MNANATSLPVAAAAAVSACLAPAAPASWSAAAACCAGHVPLVGRAVARALLDRLTLARAAGCIVAFLASAFVADCVLKPAYPASLPRVGYGDGALATLRNWLGYVMHFNAWVDQGYRRYSKHNRAFVVPSAASRPMELVVPRSQTQWMLDLPDTVLSADAAHDDMLYLDYNLIFDAPAHYAAHRRRHPGMYDPARPVPPPDAEFHTRVMHRNIRHLPALLPAIEAEVCAAVDAAFGPDATDGPDGPDEWRTITLWDAWLRVVPQVTNLLLVGPDACRDRRFTDSMVTFADTVVTNSFLLNMVPKLLHPIAGRLASIPNRRLWRRAHAALLPLVRERVATLCARPDADVHQDFITWHIRLALAENRPAELDPEAITKRLLPVEFAAIHTTVTTGFFLTLDLLTSKPEDRVVQTIIDEVASVRAAMGSDTWTKPALASLWRTDSAIRESMRFSHFATSLVKRKVVAPDGVTNPAEGWHAPYGALLMLNLAGTHHDEDLYENPDQYDAFRYARQREAFEAAAQLHRESASAPAGSDEKEKTAADAMRVPNLGMVTTSDRHLAFGHGRHACPGRFFAAHELKMVTAYLLTHYEFQPLPEKPKSIWVGQTIIPPVAAKVQVRRRRV